MDNIKNDHYYIQKLQQDLTFIVMHMRNVDIEELGKNEILQDSMEGNLWFEKSSRT